MTNRGFSIVEMLVLTGLIGIASAVVASMLVFQNRSLRGISAKAEAESINEIVRQILKDENSCAASIKDSYPTAPVNLNASLDLSRIIQRRFSGAWTNTTYYSTGVQYANLVEIVSLRLRDFVPSDLTPGPKLLVNYRYIGDVAGPSQISRSIDLFVSFAPAASDPSYAFKCSTVPFAATSVPPVVVSSSAIVCNPIGTGNVINCPVGTTPMSCGIQDTNENDDEDGVSCYLDIPGNRCVFTYDQSGNCDTNHINHCYCR